MKDGDCREQLLAADGDPMRELDRLSAQQELAREINGSKELREKKDDEDAEVVEDEEGDEDDMVLDKGDIMWLGFDEEKGKKLTITQ